MRYGGFDQEFDRLIVQHVEMISIHSRDAAMTVTHVFAQTNVGDRDDFRTFSLDRAQCFLHDAVFRVSPTSLFIFFFRDSEKQDGLQPHVPSALRFIDDPLHRQLKNAWHARDWSALVDFFAHEKWQNEIVRA